MTARVMEGDKPYVARGEARPAYERAFAVPWAINAGNPHGD